MKELWRDIKGYKGYYQVSNLGRIKSLERKCKTSKGERTVPEKIKKLGNDKNKYKIITLYKQGTNKTFKVHRLVAEAFIPNVNNLSQVNHKDENKSNNCLQNLEWCDASYNTNYGTRNEKVSNKLKKPILQFDLDGNFIREWLSATDVGREVKGRICNCLKGRYKTACGYIWKYKN